MVTPHRIDVHHHPTPTAELSKGRRVGGRGLKDWVAADSIEAMDKNGVAAALLSLPHRATQVWGGDAMTARQKAREWNEFMTRQANDHPGRFGVFAVVPILDIEGSLREAEYALDTLKADGIGLMTNIGDKWLGDPHYFPLFEELNRRKVLVYTHPISPNCSQDAMMPSIDNSMIEFCADTTRAIGRMLFSGAAHRFKDIDFIFSHGGGVMPFIVERFTRHPGADKTLNAMVPDGVITYLKRFYYDTAQVSHVHAMSSITKLLAITQLVFGTDFPFRNIEDHVGGLAACGFSADELRAIECGNIQRLLPRWRK